MLILLLAGLAASAAKTSADTAKRPFVTHAFQIDSGVPRSVIPATPAPTPAAPTVASASTPAAAPAPASTAAPLTIELIRKAAAVQKQLDSLRTLSPKNEPDVSTRIFTYEVKSDGITVSIDDTLVLADPVPEMVRRLNMSTKMQAVLKKSGFTSKSYSDAILGLQRALLTAVARRKLGVAESGAQKYWATSAPPDDAKFAFMMLTGDKGRELVNLGIKEPLLDRY